MTELSAKGSDVCAIVVTYHPDSAFPERMEAVAEQVGAIAIVDNGSVGDGADMLRRLATRLPITLHMNEANRGLACALNWGVAWARDKGYSWVLLLDQDSRPARSMVEVLLEAYRAAPRTQRIAVVGPRHWDPATRASPRVTDERRSDWREVEAVFTSGMLLPLAAVVTVGPFREEFFVDVVDTDFCLRARAKGYGIVVANGALLAHSWGRLRRHRLLGRTCWCSHHPAWRLYYVMRNTTILFREYGRTEPRWMRASVRYIAKWAVKIALFEEPRARKLWMMMLGTIDGAILRYDRRVERSR